MKNQFYPFDDFPKYSYSDRDRHGEEKSWHEIAQEMRRFPCEQKSEMLSYLTGRYLDELKENGLDKALEEFWKQVDLMREIGGLTDDMHKALLAAAEDKNIKAAQKMVRANPVVIHLPFIAQTMRGMVYHHKYCDPGKEGPLATIRDQWNGFLPSRAGGKFTYSDSDLKRLVLLAKKQIEAAGEIKGKLRGGKTPLEYARDNVGKELKISAEYIKKNTSTKARKESKK